MIETNQGDEPNQKQTSEKSNQKLTLTRLLVEGSAAVALAVVFSILGKFTATPFKISLSMVPLILFAFRTGSPYSLLVSFTYSIFNMLSDGAPVHIGSVFLDYILPFTLLGSVFLLKKVVQEISFKSYLIVFFAVLILCMLRFLFHTLSGALYFGSSKKTFSQNLVFSLIYNAKYLWLTSLTTVYLVIAFFKPLISKEKII